MWPVTRLIWKGFFKTLYVPVMAFIFPIVIYIIIRFMIPFGDEVSDFTKVNYIVPGIMIYAPMVLGSTVMPVGIMQFKESVIIKRIGVTPIRRKILTLTFAFNYVILAFLGSILFLLVALAIEAMAGTIGKDMQPLTLATSKTVQIAGESKEIVVPAIQISINVFFLNGAGIPLFISALLLGIMMSIFFGLVLSAISKSVQMVQALGMLIFLPAMFLTGMYFPMHFEDGAGIGAWISPWRSIVVLMQMAWFGTDTHFIAANINNGSASVINNLSDSLFGIKDAANLYIGKSVLSTSLALGLGIGFTTFFLIIALWKFKWASIRA